MGIKKFLRFIMLLLFIMIASIVPFPINFYKQDKKLTYEIEQFDKKKEEDEEGEAYQVFR